MQKLFRESSRRASGIECSGTAKHGGAIDDCRVVDFALDNRLLVLGFAVLLFAGGMVAFHHSDRGLSDVADNYASHHAVAGDFGGANRAAGDDSAGDRHERHPACRASALVLAVWASDIKLIFDDESTTTGTGAGSRAAEQVTLPPASTANGRIGVQWGRFISSPCTAPTRL